MANTLKSKSNINFLYVQKVHSQAQLPTQATTLAAGFDVYAVVGANDTKLTDSKMLVGPGQTILINTGLLMRPAPGFCIKLFPRSGLALKHGITLMNAVGLVDEDFSHTIGVILHNHGSEGFIVNNGDRICQIKMERVEPTEIVEVDELPEPSQESNRDGGFGSSGTGKLNEVSLSPNNGNEEYLNTDTNSDLDYS